jgi:CheY-like chemotaxis protein
MYKILVADDIYVNRLLMKEITKKYALEYFEAQNGAECIDILKNNKIDIIFMDIEMPIMNGIETASYIRNNMKGTKKNIPIVALTAHRISELHQLYDNYNNVGFNKTLTKPYKNNEFLNCINEICKK